MDVAVLDLFGHLFYASLALGIFLLAKKSRWGWVFRFVGQLGWLWIGVGLEMSSIWGWGTLFLFMECYGYWSWAEKGPPS